MCVVVVVVFSLKCVCVHSCGNMLVCVWRPTANFLCVPQEPSLYSGVWTIDYPLGLAGWRASQGAYLHLASVGITSQAYLTMPDFLNHVRNHLLSSKVSILFNNASQEYTLQFLLFSLPSFYFDKELNISILLPKLRPVFFDTWPASIKLT